ncbi:hypothetical protein [Macrococcus carouselicus]|uniref:Uncharacterized protein n=1 Tax=Macrococcus carouselicus TaxID=69969 RepID=A0A9Q8CL80_9STAP|nr:hypothetical protein [Macrococcus carouselicus]TDM04683.1 hypothetical protein ERX40_05850 [Macrococcus carouselicus]
MPKIITYISLLISILILLLFIFFQNDKDETVKINPDKETILYVFGHGFNKSGKIVRMDDDKVVKESKLYRENLNALKSRGNRHYLWSGHNKKLVEIDSSLNLKEKTNKKDDILFFDKKEDIEVIAYNIDTTKTTVEIKDGNQKITKNFPPLVVKSLITDKKIYLYSDNMINNLAAVYVYDREKENFEEITLHHINASEMKLVNDKLVLTTENELTVINTTTKDVKYYPLKNHQLLLNISDINKEMYITYAEEGQLGVMKVSEQGNVKLDRSMPFRYYDSKVVGNKLYAIDIDEDKKLEYTMNIIDIEQWKVIKKYRIPHQENNLTDFEVINKASNE